MCDYTSLRAFNERDHAARNTRLRLERLQTTLFKIIGQLETCKLLIDDIKRFQREADAIKNTRR